jgi:hypothetical protein
MRREDRDELLRGFLAINAMLREEAKALRRAIDARRDGKKHNPNWRLQPRAPRGTRDGGQWIESGGTAGTSKTPRAPKSGDPMDGSDAATFGEMLNYEFGRRRYTHALEATQDPRTRMRIANDRAMLARQTFGNFSHEEEEKIYAEEMRTRRGHIALGGTDLSERALRRRQGAGEPVGDGQNVAVIEYRDRTGELRYIERVSQPGRHAEELIVADLQRLGIPPANVTRIYSDRQPCLDRCQPLLRRYVNARTTWAVDWPNDAEGRTRANNALNRQIRSYHRMSAQDTLPMPLWRQPNPDGNDIRPRRQRRRR